MLATATVLLAVAVAFLVAFVQIAAGRFSPFIARLALRDTKILAYLGALSIIFLTFASAALVVSLPPPHPTLGQLTVNQEREVVGVAALFLIVVAASLVGLLIQRAAGFTSGPLIAERLVRSIPRTALAHSLDDREVEVRADEAWLRVTWFSRLARVLNDSAEDSATSVHVEHPNADNRPIEYPLLRVSEALNQAVRDGDRFTFERTLLTFEQEWPEWIRAARSEVRRDLLVENARLKFFDDIPELIERHGVPSLHTTYLSAVGRLAEAAYCIQPSLINQLLDHLQKSTVRLALAGDDKAAAAGAEALFRLEAAFVDDEKSMTSVHQALGTLGRTIGHFLPAPLGFQYGPGFGYLDESKSETVDALIEGYGALTHRLQSHTRDIGSYIWLEALETTIETLLKRGVATGAYEAVSRHAISLMLDLCPTVEALAYRENDRSLFLAILALKRLANTGVDEGQEELWDLVAYYAATFGALGHDLQSSDLGERDDDRAIEIFNIVPQRYWDKAMREVSTRHMNEGPDFDAIWSFVRRAGVQLRTNFGLMFDADTGEPYPLDDSRRS